MKSHYHSTCTHTFTPTNHFNSVWLWCEPLWSQKLPNKLNWLFAVKGLKEPSGKKNCNYTKVFALPISIRTMPFSSFQWKEHSPTCFLGFSKHPLGIIHEELLVHWTSCFSWVWDKSLHCRAHNTDSLECVFMTEWCNIVSGKCQSKAMHKHPHAWHEKCSN